MNRNNDAEVVCFGMIAPAVVLRVDDFPAHNTGALIRDAVEFISDDAAIVAGVLRGWNVRSGLIGTTLGDDERGRRAARRLKELGVLGKIRFSKKIATPYEVNVSDRTGARTYFWQRDPRVLATLDTAPLDLLNRAKMLYVDWYDDIHILRAMRAARKRGIPVFLNFEHGHANPDLLARYAPFTTICQATTDDAQHGRDARTVARKLLDAVISTALVTLAGDGCLAATRDQTIRVRAPRVEIVDGCGAGATFSAGFLYGFLRGWNLESSTRFAIAAASLKVSVMGPRAFPRARIKRFANEIRIDTIAL
ncbi:MAG: carbohydrate kinase family protein [Chloroflexi bacterium]|nr:carbohydrate kinase family protein [Chloroflexota bacterium]